jgi:KaiC/GvpD/RAD55 family RecA-like ATPase
LVDRDLLVDDGHKLVFDLIQKAHEVGHEDVSTEEVRRLLKDDAGGGEGTGKHQLAAKLLDLMQAEGPPHGVALVETKSWLQRSVLRKLKYECLEEVPPHRFKQKWEKIQEISDRITNIAEIGVVNHVDPIDISKVKDLKDDGSPREPLRISPTMDASMRGGPKIGKVGCIVAPTGVGKSQLLANIAAEAVRAGRTVFHFSLEMDAQDMLPKFYSILTNIPLEEIEAREAEALGMWQPSWGKLKLWDFTGKRCKIETVEKIIRAEIARGEHPSILIVDALVLLDRVEENRYIQLAMEIRRLRQLGSRYRFLSLTAAQAGRAAVERGTTFMYDVQDSWGVPQECDFCILASQREDEKEMGTMRLRLSKNRLGGTNPMPIMVVDYDTWRVWERGHQPRF